MKRFGKTTLSLLLAGSLTGCFGGGDDDVGQQQQLLRGHVPLSQYSADIVGVRIVSQGQTVATAATDATGNFNIKVPQGRDYSFEIVSRSGGHTLLVGPLNGTSPTTFDVCDPGEDFDLGDINPLDFEEIDGDEVPWSDYEDECEPPPWICGDEAGPQTGEEPPCWTEPLPCDAPEADPSFCWDEPLPCDDSGADPNFCWTDPPPCDSLDDPNCGEPPLPPLPCDNPNDPECEGPEFPHPCQFEDDPGCGEPPPYPCEESDDPTCEEPPLPPLPCDDSSGSNCEEPPTPCDDPSDDPSAPGCEEPPPFPCDTDDSNCEPPTPCDDPSAPGCEEPPPFPCDTDDSNCEPPTPCDDPSAPGCEEPPPWDGTCTSGYEDPICWPEPEVCLITPDGQFIECDDTGAAPEFPLPDFGCE